MKATSAIFVLCFVTISAFTSCTTIKLNYQRLLPGQFPKLVIKEKSLYSPDSSQQIKGKSIAPQSVAAFFIEDVYTAMTNNLLVFCLKTKTAENKKYSFLAMNLSHGDPLWAYEANTRNCKWITADSTYFSLRASKTILIDSYRGSLKKGPTENFSLVPSKHGWLCLSFDSYRAISQAADVNSDPRAERWNFPSSDQKEPTYDLPTFTISARDFATDKLLWNRDIVSDNWDFHDYLNVQRNSMIFLSNGIENVNLQSGAGWYYPLKTTDKEGEAGAALLNTASAALILLGGVSAGSASSWNVHHLSSEPLFQEQKLFIAAKNKVYCFNDTTGRVKWYAEIPDAYGNVDMFYKDGQVVLIYFGHRFASRTTNNFEIISRVKSGNPAFILLLDAESGKQIARHNFPANTFLLDYSVADDGIIVLSPSTLYQFSQKLDLKAEVNAFSLGAFSKFITVGHRLLVRTINGLFELNKGSMEPIWQIGTTPIPMDVFENTKRTYLRNDFREYMRSKSSPEIFDALMFDYNYNNFFQDNEKLWFGSHKELYCVDLNSGLKLFKIPVPDNAKLIDSGFLTITDKKSFEYYLLKQQ